MDIAFFHALNNFAASAPSLSAVAVFCAETLGYLLIVLLGYSLFTHEDKRRGTKEIVVMLTTALFAWILAHAIKYFYYTPRPFVALQDVEMLFPQEANGAFPSGHATFFSALAMAMYFYHKKLAYFLGIGAIIIGIARVASGVHYPTDILAGFVLGGFIAWVVHQFLDSKAKSLPNA